MGFQLCIVYLDFVVVFCDTFVDLGNVAVLANFGTVFSVVVLYIVTGCVDVSWIWNNLVVANCGSVFVVYCGGLC